jgi:GNAT superfamily N-acetyltransferase
MPRLLLRAMTSDEFDDYRVRSIGSYAAAHVRAGDWPPEGAEQRAARETERLLPEGLTTPGMLLLVAEVEGLGAVGAAWLAIDAPDNRGAWVYDIEISPERRGQGYGRDLLRALERLAAGHGANTLGLNVFGENAVARNLYESCGYRIASLHMRKTLQTPDAAA